MRKRILAALAIATWACSDSAGPPSPVPAAQLHFLQQDSTGPALLATSGSFYAKVGTDRQLQLYYQGATPGDTGQAFLKFDVRGDALLKRPDGTLFQPGDSILITVTVTDPTRFDFTFGPTGLQFNPADPARLHIEYNHANHDFNDDGRINAEDDTTESKLNFWRSEPPSTMWTAVGAARNETFDEIEAKVLSFTQYAVAW